MLTVLLGLALLNGFIYIQQPSITFFPHSTLQQSPKDWGLSYEDVYLDTEDGVRLHSWFIPSDNAQKTILFFHGNAGNISHRRSSIEIFNRLGLNILIIDYRGFGKSQGRVSEQGLYKDATAAWLYLVNEREVNPENIIIFGRSLGGIVATELSARVQPGGVIIESTFSSARDIADAMFSVLSRIIILRYDFNALENIKQIESPILVLHSPDDEIVPFRLGKKLFNAANEPKTFVEMRGGHNTGLLMSQPEYEMELERFITSLPQSHKEALNN